MLNNYKLNIFKCDNKIENLQLTFVTVIQNT